MVVVRPGVVVALPPPLPPPPFGADCDPDSSVPEGYPQRIGFKGESALNSPGSEILRAGWTAGGEPGEMSGGLFQVGHAFQQGYRPLQWRR